MSRILLTLTFLVWASHAFAQTRKIDSLKAVLARHPQADTFRVNRIIELAKEGFKKKPPTHPQQIDSLLAQALQLAQRLNYPYGQANVLWFQSALQYWRGQHEKSRQTSQLALIQARRSGDKAFLLTVLLDISYSARGEQQRDYFNQAVAIAKATGDTNVIFDTQMSIIYVCADNYLVALQWALPLLTTVEKRTNLSHHYQVLERLSTIYSGLKDYDQALFYLKQMQRVGRQLNSKVYQGSTLASMGEMYQEKGLPGRAIEILKQALPYLNDQWQWVASIEELLAQCYEQQGNHQAAIQHAHQALITLPINNEDAFYQVPAWLVLSQSYLTINRLDSALYYGLKCLQKEVVFLNNGRLETPRDVYKVLAQIYARKNQYVAAYRYQTRFITYKDSLNNENITRKATAAQFAQQMNKQQTQITLLRKDKQLQTEESKRQRLLLYTSLVVLALIGGLLALVYRNNRQKQKANALLAQQRDQINQTLTDLKTTQNQLIQKEKMASLGELTAGIAHEIQNPLNFVNNFSEVSTEMVEELAEESQKPQRDSSLENDLLTDLRANLQKINHHGQRASNIVKGMLEHSRSSTGDVQPTNLNGLADEYLRLAYHGQRRSGDPAKNKDFNCELVTDLDSSIGQVSVMSQEIGRVLLNLFSNAFYAVHQRQRQGEPGYQPAVRIRTRRLAKGVEIRISDNGVGMAKEVQQKIFQPFFTTKPTGEGTGLGLSLSYDIITKSHGGTLAVESQEGEGTEFIITIPV